MTKLAGVECRSCGASTPLPDDLTVASFHCRYCHAELVTKDYAGAAAVSADALLEHIDRAVATKMSPSESASSAPRFEDRHSAVRDSACLDCAAPIVIPMDLNENFVTCAACGRVQAIAKHVPQQERFELDMQRQVAGNEALAKLYAEGSACLGCGGINRFPDDGSMQIVCSFCGKTLLIGEYVDPSAVARRRLKHGVFEMRDEMRRQEEESAANARFFAIVFVAIAVVVALVVKFGGGG